LPQHKQGITQKSNGDASQTTGVAGNNLNHKYYTEENNEDYIGIMKIETLC